MDNNEILVKLGEQLNRIEEKLKENEERLSRMEYKTDLMFSLYVRKINVEADCHKGVVNKAGHSGYSAQSLEEYKSALEEARKCVRG